MPTRRRTRRLTGAIALAAAVLTLSTGVTTAGAYDGSRSAPCGLNPYGPNPAPSPVATRPGNSGEPQADGSVSYSRGGAPITLRGAILQRYLKEGGPDGTLGWPQSGEVLLSGGSTATFLNGTIYSSPRGGARVVKGNIHAAWGREGFERSPIGWPTSDLIQLRDGCVQRFTGGLIYDSHQGGAWTVRGAVVEKYAQLGWERSYLGYPTSEEIRGPRGVVQNFRSGAIYWSPQTGAHPVGGAIGEAYRGQNYQASWLGFPTGEEFRVGGSIQQNFENGWIRWRWVNPRESVVSMARWDGRRI